MSCVLMIIRGRRGEGKLDKQRLAGKTPESTGRHAIGYRFRREVEAFTEPGFWRSATFRYPFLCVMDMISPAGNTGACLYMNH